MFTQFHLRPGSISFVIFLTIKIISSSFLVSVILDSVLAKVYSDCELVKEIHFEHLVPRDDIYKHLCASGRDTSSWSRGGKALVDADCKFEFDREVHRCLDFNHWITIFVIFCWILYEEWSKVNKWNWIKTEAKVKSQTDNGNFLLYISSVVLDRTRRTSSEFI